jgi:hypothetical protein
MQNGIQNSQLILEAKKTQRLADSSTKDIFDILTKAMILLGIKGDRLPSEFEMDYMAKMVKVDYANLPIGEFELAFDLMIKDKLDENPETYQNFSALYLSRLMSSYARWAYKYRIEEKIEPQKELAAPQMDDDEVLKMSLDIYKRNKDWNHIFMGLKCFKIIHKRGHITDVEGTLKRTEEAIRRQYQYASHKERKEMNRLLEDDEHMELACRRMAVAEYFNKLI